MTHYYEFNTIQYSHTFELYCDYIQFAKLSDDYEMTKYAKKKFKNIISDYGDFKRIDFMVKYCKLVACHHALQTKMGPLRAIFKFICWIHGHLGKSVRQVISACVVSAIHKEFLDPNGNYTGCR